ncbi:type VII toxin-antitoxin system MntA family adenylyltransferase antitoxin [Salinibacter ruber]|uniref:type VII toxin-antitoxin system MntA family adenylyltransferase antitoxin n=1 Tax=Salinibacter ruber TaxID=146919 RepID=UPI001F0734E6|nr:nucleotidyltransferase domain-containing protein [Salinibacter ruber]
MLSETTEHRLRNVFADHPAVRAAYLFGSVAAGRERDRSDLDLGIVVDSDRWEPTDDKVPLITDCMEAAGRDWIDLVVLNGAPLVLQFEAVRPNAPLYGADDFDHGAFISKVVRMYWDFEPYLRRQRKALKERLQEKAHG